MKFEELKKEELKSIEGGGFAYWAGRAIRFAAFATTNPSIALMDWDIANAVNDAVNG